MLANKLKISEQKTEFLVVASPRMEGKFLCRELIIRIGDSIINPTNKQAHSLGVIFDRHFTMHAQVSNICCNAYYIIYATLARFGVSSLRRRQRNSFMLLSPPRLIMETHSCITSRRHLVTSFSVFSTLWQACIEDSQVWEHSACVEEILLATGDCSCRI